MKSSELDDLRLRVEAGGGAKYHAKNAETGKWFARERIRQLLDAGSFVEDGALARATEPELPADGVVTGLGTIAGRTVALMANDSTVKAGSWGELTVEKILRVQETARRLACPMFYLVDSAGARIPDQLRMFPGRRGAGRIFFNQVSLSGVIPQICLLFGPSAAGGAYIPAFCDVVVMVENNASMYLGSPRMAEMVIGEKVSLDEMGGAKMHTTISGCGDVLVKSEQAAIAWAKAYLEFMPQNNELPVLDKPALAPKSGQRPLEEIVLPDENKSFDMHEVIAHVIDEGSFLELKPKFAKELITGFARIAGRAVGIVANQPKHLGGVLFVDSADKAARFVQLCDSFNVPLLFLADVPGFMIGSKVERQGIIRAGAKMVAAVSLATVPKICVVVRKAYGAGLYAMCGPAFEPDACLALPTASIAVMGPQAAVNAVYFNRIQAEPEGPARDKLVAELRDEYRADVDLTKIASELVVDELLAFESLRPNLAARYALLTTKRPHGVHRKHMIMPM
jgi:methylmalonyl-CoA decarboxylase subunit alpha